LNPRRPNDFSGDYKEGNVLQWGRGLEPAETALDGRAAPGTGVEERMESAPRNTRFSLVACWKLTKPRLWLMLTYTAGIGFLASLKVHPGLLRDGILAIVATALGTSGANAITCYLDRDIDSIMERTKKRPLPRGDVHPPTRALWLGLGLAASSLVVLLIFAKYVAALIGLLGLIDNVLVYSVWLKRRSPLNIVLGSFSGGAPVVVGWSVNASILSPVPILLASIVVLWIPSHIWSLAFRWRDDYSKAGIPMLTAIIDKRKAMLCVASTSFLIFLFSIVLVFAGPFGSTYLIVASIAGAVLLALTLWMTLRPYGAAPRVLFKYTSPYLAILLAATVI